MELDYKAIGKRIKIARIKADLTQERLAERIGISPTHLSNIETGTTRVSLSMERDHLQENAEYAVNNVKYQVSASFQTPDDKIPAEDFADKLKRLILSEDIMNRNGKK